MWPDWILNLEPLALKSYALPTALRRRASDLASGKQSVTIKVLHSTQGINESANFCFLQRLSVIFGFR